MRARSEVGVRAGTGVRGAEYFDRLPTVRQVLAQTDAGLVALHATETLWGLRAKPVWRGSSSERAAADRMAERFALAMSDMLSLEALAPSACYLMVPKRAFRVSGLDGEIVCAIETERLRLERAAGEGGLSGEVGRNGDGGRVSKKSRAGDESRIGGKDCPLCASRGLSGLRASTGMASLSEEAPFRRAPWPEVLSSRLWLPADFDAVERIAVLASVVRTMTTLGWTREEAEENASLLSEERRRVMRRSRACVERRRSDKQGLGGGRGERGLSVSARVRKGSERERRLLQERRVIDLERASLLELRARAALLCGEGFR